MEAPALVGAAAVVLWCVAAAVAPRAVSSVTGFLLRSPATLVHEFGHAATATLAGGFAVSLRFDSATTARVRSIHLTWLSQVLTPPAGYLAVPAVGAAFVAIGLLGQDSQWDAIAYWALGLIGVVCLLLSRNGLALVASLWMIGLAASLLHVSWMGAQWVGVALVLSGVVEAFKVFLAHIWHGREVDSDATATCLRFAHPAFHTAVWAIASLAVAVVCAIALWSAWTHGFTGFEVW
jgi:hypothetical protein